MTTFTDEPGGAREVRNNIEWLDQCIASRGALEPELRGWLGGVKIPRPPHGKKH